MDGSDLVRLGFVSPVPVGVLCVLYFVFAADRMGIGFKGVTRRFVRRALLWAAIGFGAVVVIALASTAKYGPLGGIVLLLLHGPVAISCGMIVGTIQWRLREGKALASSSADAP
jgi:hypothetical protein